MASKNISEFPAASTIANGDLIPIWQGGATKKLTYATLQEKLTAVPSPAVLGVGDDSNAAAGIVGQVIENTRAFGAAVAVNDGVKTEITTVTLTPGDWDVSGVVVINVVQSIISNPMCGFATPAAANLGDDLFALDEQHDIQISNDGQFTMIPPLTRFKVAAATTKVVKLALKSDITPNGVPATIAWGRIVARRAR